MILSLAMIVAPVPPFAGCDGGGGGGGGRSVSEEDEADIAGSTRVAPDKAEVGCEYAVEGCCDDDVELDEARGLGEGDGWLWDCTRGLGPARFKARVWTDIGGAV